MPRKKPQPTLVIQNLEHANDTLALMTKLKRNIDGEEVRMNSKIDMLKKAAKEKTQRDREQLKNLETALGAFAEYNKPSLFDKKRTLNLSFGDFGFRKSKEIKPQPKMKIADILAALKRKKWRNGITVKETVNKDVLHEWTDDKLAQISARRVVKDTFWYELKEEEIDK